MSFFGYFLSNTLFIFQCQVKKSYISLPVAFVCNSLAIILHHLIVFPINHHLFLLFPIYPLSIYKNTLKKKHLVKRPVYQTGRARKPSSKIAFLEAASAEAEAAAARYAANAPARAEKKRQRLAKKRDKERAKQAQRAPRPPKIVKEKVYREPVVRKPKKVLKSWNNKDGRKSYYDMICEALLVLKNRKGTSSIAIENHIVANNPDLTFKRHVMRNSLKTHTEAGRLIRIKNSYKFDPVEKKLANKRY